MPPVLTLAASVASTSFKPDRGVLPSFGTPPDRRARNVVAHLVPSSHSRGSPRFMLHRSVVPLSGLPNSVACFPEADRQLYFHVAGAIVRHRIVGLVELRH